MLILEQKRVVLFATFKLRERFRQWLQMNYIPRNFEPFKEELARVRLFKLQLLNTLLSSFLVLVHYI